MESLLTSTAESLVISFALLMALDFFSGLVHLYRSTPSQTEPKTETEVPVKACHKGIESLIGQLTVLPEDNGEPQTSTPLAIAGWNVVEPVGDKPATLSWLSTAIKPDTLDATEQPRDRSCNKVDSPYLNSLCSARDVGVVSGCPQYSEKLLPNVIEMARFRLLLPQVVGGEQRERDLTVLGIRELKKLASAAKIKRYNVMTKTQLIDQLAAKEKLTAGARALNS